MRSEEVKKLITDSLREMAENSAVERSERAAIDEEVKRTMQIFEEKRAAANARAKSKQDADLQRLNQIIKAYNKLNERG